MQIFQAWCLSVLYIINIINIPNMFLQILFMVLELCYYIHPFIHPSTHPLFLLLNIYSVPDIMY